MVIRKGDRTKEGTWFQPRIVIRQREAQQALSGLFFDKGFISGNHFTLERGFTSLTVCFGCTGGQHRSVYSAQHLAEHLHRKFGVEVELTHREQAITQTFKATTRL